MTGRLRTLAVLPAAALLVGGAIQSGLSVAILSDTPRMHAHRAAHTATTLDDGRVLVVGGFAEHSAHPDSEFYQPGLGLFTPGPPMQQVRHSHTATRLRDGRVLITGGYGEGGHTLSSAEIFDPGRNVFTPIGSLHTARANHTATRLGDDRVLLVGGLGRDWAYLASAEVFDPASGAFNPVAPMSVPREGHAAVLLADGGVLMVGGHQGPRRALTIHATAEIFDPRTATFRRTGSMALRRHKHDAVRLQDGRVLVTGGADERDGEGAYASTEVYDPRVHGFAPGPTMRHARYKHLGSSILLRDGLVLVAGGAATAEALDLRAGHFVEVAAMSRLPGLFSAVAALADGRVFISGGYGRHQGPVDAAWIYTPAGAP